MRLLRVAVVACLAAVPVAWAEEREVADDPGVAGSLRLLEGWIQAHMAYRGLPGLSIGIVHDQKLVWSRGFGHADVASKTPATAETLYRIASNTKTFTATAILQLRDRGKLRLDDPVSRYRPWFKVRSSFPDAPVITIRQLITHTSGLPRESAGPYWIDFAFPTRDQMIAALPGQEAPLAPETRLKYSNLAFALAGEIVASISAEPYDQYVRKHILEPLGMASTAVTLTPELRRRLATGYGRRMPDGRREVMKYTETKGLAPAAEMSSCVLDLARWASFQMRDGTETPGGVLKPATLREMHRVQWMNPDGKDAWGLGFAVGRLGEKRIFGHGGALAGYRTQVSVSPDDKVAVIVLTNSDDGRPGGFARKALDWVAPAIAKAAAPPAQASQPDPEWSRYVGVYRSIWGDSQVLVMDGQLVLVDPTEDDPKESVLTLTPVGPHTFRESFSGAEGGDVVTFELGPDGKVARMKEGDNYSVPVSY